MYRKIILIVVITLLVSDTNGQWFWRRRRNEVIQNLRRRINGSPDYKHGDQQQRAENFIDMLQDTEQQEQT
uniref:Uncharacterized protein n=1 Tax=Ciona intestinalis TaxID=7719 RepID=F6TUC0_CIOIN